MRTATSLLLSTLLFLSLTWPDAAVGQDAEGKEPIDYVDPLIGSSNSRWMMFPGASMPFGMVKLSPDNEQRGWKAGYEYNIDNIAGFSHIHSWTMAGVLMMPATGPVHVKPGPPSNPDRGYRSRFSHENEEASPGYYSVRLSDYGLTAELTSTTRAGFQRYTFPESDSARILFDLQFLSEYGFELHGAKIEKVSNTEIQGFSIQQSLRGANYNEYTVHFVIRFSKPFRTLNGWTRSGIKTNIDSLFSGWDHTDFGGYVTFNTSEGEEVKVQTGISLVSIDQARKNLEWEMQEPFGWDFEEVRKNARNEWNDLLGTIEVEGGTEENKKKFYTNLYRSYVGRTIWSDVDGTYVDMCEEVTTTGPSDHPVYGGDAFWNTFWNLNQLWTLATPAVASNWVQSLLEMYERGGWLSKGPTGIEYSSIMVASHEIPLIVSAYQKGIRDYDVETAYEAIKHNQMTPGKPHECGGYVGNRQLESYMNLGYVPTEKGPVSNTMEYAYDDWTVSQMAKSLDRDFDHRYFRMRSKYYKNVFDPSVGYVRMKDKEGDWVGEFDPFCCSTFRGAGYVEGNAWQYTFFAPHDVQGIVDLLGREKFNERLNSGFEKSQEYRFNAEQIDYDNNLHAMGLLPVNHGNQPNMQAAYLFNYSGKPWLTQKWARAIMDEYYGTGPESGWPGDEDQGQMGAWFVMSAMGLFEMNGGASAKPVYEIGSPLFEKVTIHLDGEYYSGDEFVIEAEGVSSKNKYVQSAELEGESLNRPWFYHHQLVDGGKLILEMGPEPDTSWGSAPGDAPPSLSSTSSDDSKSNPSAGTLPSNVEDFEGGHYERFAPIYLGDSESWVRPSVQTTDERPIRGDHSLRWTASGEAQEWVLVSNAFYLRKPFRVSVKVRAEATQESEFKIGLAAMETEDTVASVRLTEVGAEFGTQAWGDSEVAPKEVAVEEGTVYTLELSVGAEDRLKARVLDEDGREVYAEYNGRTSLQPEAIGLYVSTSASGGGRYYFDEVSVTSAPYRLAAGRWANAPDPIAFPRPPDVGQEQGNWIGGMSVREIQGEQRMWYRIRNNDQRGAGYGLAVRRDGEEWERVEGNPILEPDPKYESVEKISVLRVDGRYRAWYAVDTGDSWAVAHASSEDGRTWEKEGVVIEGYCKDPSVVYVGGRYYMYAIGPTEEDVSVYVSEDGVEWERRKTYSEGGHRHPSAYFVDRSGVFRLYVFGADGGVRMASSEDGITFDEFEKVWSSHEVGLSDWERYGVDYGSFVTDVWGHMQTERRNLMYYQARHDYENNPQSWKFHGDGKILASGRFEGFYRGVPATVRPVQRTQYHAFPYAAARIDGLSVTASAPVTVTVQAWNRGADQVSRGTLETKKGAQVRFSVTGLRPGEEYKLRAGGETSVNTADENGETTFVIDLGKGTSSVFEVMDNNI